MRRCRFEKPEVRTIPLSDGDTITVKKRLNAGERREMINSMLDAGGQVDAMRSGYAICLAYLVDWTFVGFDDKPLVILQQPPEVLAAALNALKHEDFVEVKEAIEKHETEMKAQREAEKKTLHGSTTSSTTSPSPSDSAGDTSGSTSSTPTSTTSP